MAVLCPMYDPDIGWYIVVNGGKKQQISSLLYYYYSLGVSPPVGAEITEDDIEDFQYTTFYHHIYKLLLSFFGNKSTYEDEFEDESSLMYNCFSNKSSSSSENSEMSYNNINLL